MKPVLLSTLNGPSICGSSFTEADENADAGSITLRSKEMGEASCDKRTDALLTFFDNETKGEALAASLIIFLPLVTSQNGWSSGSEFTSSEKEFCL